MSTYKRKAHCIRNRGRSCEFCFSGVEPSQLPNQNPQPPPQPKPRPIQAGVFESSSGSEQISTLLFSACSFRSRSSLTRSLPVHSFLHRSNSKTIFKHSGPAGRARPCHETHTFGVLVHSHPLTFVVAGSQFLLRVPCKCVPTQPSPVVPVCGCWPRRVDKSREHRCLFNSFCLLLLSDFHPVEVPSLPLSVACLIVACG